MKFTSNFVKCENISKVTKQEKIDLNRNSSNKLLFNESPTIWQFHSYATKYIKYFLVIFWLYNFFGNSKLILN